MPDLHRLINQLHRVETRLAIADHHGDADIVKTAVDVIRDLAKRLTHAQIDLSIAEAQRRGCEDRLGHALARVHRLEDQPIGQFTFKTGERHG